MGRQRRGTIIYQITEALKILCNLGVSRHELKRLGLADKYIVSASTMKDYLAIACRFGRWCQERYGIKDTRKITPVMANRYVQELRDKGRSGGYIGRVTAAVRKLDVGMKERGDRPQDAPELLAPGGGWHSDRRPERAYSPEAAGRIIGEMKDRARDKQTATVAELQLVAGLRVKEAVNLRGKDIDVERCQIRAKKGTKGGRERTVRLDPKHREFLRSLKKQAKKNRDGHVFQSRNRLDDRTRGSIRHACRRLEQECCGTHGFRKTYAQERYKLLRSEGLSDEGARLKVAQELGHNRLRVTYSYIPEGAG